MITRKMHEVLLTDEEIIQIIEESKKAEYSNPSILHLGGNKTAIFRVSLKTGLILVHGNDWTGKEHIYNRHSLTSRIPYWQEGDRIGNPTKFSLDIAQIHYVSLADEIYKPENLNNQKNDRKELFEMYFGKIKFMDFPILEYTLVLYKNTKIIHTLFISSNKKPYNKKKILDLRQGWTGFSQNVMTGTVTFEIPYFDSSNIERFKVVLRSIVSMQLDRWYIQVNNFNGIPRITMIIKEEKMTYLASPMDRCSILDFGNLTWIEKEIKKLI